MRWPGAPLEINSDTNPKLLGQWMFGDDLFCFLEITINLRAKKWKLLVKTFIWRLFYFDHSSRFFVPPPNCFALTAMEPLCLSSTPTQSGPNCNISSGWVTTTGKLLGPKMALGVFLKDTWRATASKVKPRFRTLSITSPALCQLSCAAVAICYYLSNHSKVETFRQAPYPRTQQVNLPACPCRCCSKKASKIFFIVKVFNYTRHTLS